MVSRSDLRFFNASDLALKTMQKGKLLVVYFGEKSFAWCNQLELKPFLENFKEFSKISDSLAVEEAVREIGEQVEKFLVCDDEASSVCVNSGIKKGVAVVPDLRREIVSSLVLENHPGLVLDDLKRLAKTVCFSDLLEIEVLKRKLLVFYRCKGRFGLAKFDEHQFIIGLEDKEDEESCKRLLLRKCSKKKRKFGFGDDVATTTTGSTTRRWERLSQVTKIEEEKISNGKSLSSKKRKKSSKNDLATPLALVQTGKRERKKSKYLSPEYMTDFSCKSRKIKIHKRDLLAEVKQQVLDEKKFTGVELFSKTDFGSTLPSRDDLIKIYKKFGALDMWRSYIFYNHSFALVAFSNVSDGEEAYNKSIEKCPFATTSSTVTFKLKYPSSKKKEAETRKSVIEVEVLKEKVEQIRGLLDQSDGGVTEELKMKLEGESRNLLDKVSNMIVPSS